MVAGIYLITNKINGHMYVGGSVDIEKRFQEHQRGDNTDVQAIDRAIIKYGKDNFIYQIITELPADWDIIRKHEIYWIKFYNTFNDRRHYNLTDGGEGRSGYKKPKELFEYTVTKYNKKHGFAINKQNGKPLIRCVLKEKLFPICEALNNKIIEENDVTEAYNIDCILDFLNGKKDSIQKGFFYHVNKFGKSGFRILNKKYDTIKVCKDKNKLNIVCDALNAGKINEEQVKSIWGVDKVIELIQSL